VGVDSFLYLNGSDVTSEGTAPPGTTSSIGPLR
jgi:hypothetical protein